MEMNNRNRKTPHVPLYSLSLSPAASLNGFLLLCLNLTETVLVNLSVSQLDKAFGTGH